MKLDDITVTVRDKSLVRQGIIVPAELNLTASVDHNNVGSWTLSLRADHPLAAILRTPGSGLIVDGPEDVLFSGPMVTPTEVTSTTDPGGTLTIEGVTDTVILADTLAYPDPSRAVNAQRYKADRRSGFAETLMHAYVNVNIGSFATAARKKAGLTTGTDLGRGAYVTKAPNFQPLGELLAELAIQEGLGLGFRVVQRGAGLVFETYRVSDKSDIIRLDARNGSLASQKVATSPPGLTVAIVGGQGVDETRQLSEYTTAASVAAQAQWGRRIERFIDQRTEDDPAELAAAGKEALDDAGFSAVSAQTVPSDDSAATFGTDWNLGDRVAVTVDGQELKVDVTGYVLKADATGFRVGVTIGDPTQFGDGMASRVSSVESRISAIERNTGVETTRPYTEWVVPNLKASASSAIPPNAWQVLRWTVKRDSSADPAGTDLIPHNFSVGGGEFTTRVPGRYLVSARVTFPSVPSGTVGYRYIALHSSTRGMFAYQSLPGNSTSFTALSVSDAIRLASNETVWVQVFQSAGGLLTLVPGDAYARITIEHLGR
ncbi:siphovirus ReqiPepy6 Gp37-like family protein [Kribbella italica]|uniref:Gp28/Gp37-like domain-containing protein n=1 Tax=Kribbella italica TaxID=1540520 RepID=A0A7W9J0H9_9ACTN|nr:siphovirus ReqiPepy6 Gp37-like family protein [Kribbella italica]MBB5833407.1 hypothetical protein [Kribbella italica]